MALIGGCLCGAVRYEITGTPRLVSRCYCNDCKKDTGTGHITVVGVAEESFHMTGEVSTFVRPGGSGKDVVRSFCTRCGTTLTGRPAIMPGIVMVRAGTLDDPGEVTPTRAIFVSRAVHWDQPPAGLPAFAEGP